MKVVYYIVFFFWYLLSLLPLRFLYIFSDVLYYPLYYCIRYRRKVVRQNLTGSFPDKNEKETYPYREAILFTSFAII